MSDETCMHVACGRRVAGRIPESCLKMCSKCRSIVYCSKKCQTVHWKTKHKTDCKEICEGNLTDDERQIITNVMEKFEARDFKEIVDSFEESMQIAACIRSRNAVFAFFIYKSVAFAYYSTEEYTNAIPIFVTCTDLEGEMQKCYSRMQFSRIDIDNLRSEVCLVKIWLANCYKNTFFFSSAREHFNNTLNFWYEEIPWELYVDTLLGSAELYNLVGDSENALTTLNKIFVILYEDIGKLRHLDDVSGGFSNAEHMCKIHNAIAFCYLEMGYYRKAITQFEIAEEIINTLVDKSNIKYVMLGLGEGWCLLENYTEAMKCNSKACELIKTGVRKIDVVWAEVNMAMILLHGGVKYTGHDGIQKARNFLISATEKRCKCTRTIDATLHLSYISLAMKNEEVALKYLYEYLDMVTKIAKQRCAGCGQDRGEGVSMLKCGNCKVARSVCVQSHSDFTHSCIYV